MEFIHNIFKEFLIADALLKKEKGLEILLAKAPDKDWAGVLVCAAASPVRVAAAAIVRQLLGTGEWRAELLALRCHSVKRYFDDALEPEVQAVAERLFPPQDAEQSEAIATLGNAATERLKFRDELSASQAEACVLALGFINTDDARAAAGTYVNDERVFDELVRVINPLLIPKVLALVQVMEWHDEEEEWRKQIVDLKPLKAHPEITVLDLWRTGVSDVTPLNALTKLQILDLSKSMKGKMLGVVKLKGKIIWW